MALPRNSLAHRAYSGGRTSDRPEPGTLHGLLDLRARRQRGRPPVGVARQHGLGGRQPAVRRLDAARGAALLHRAYGLQQELARLDHRAVGRPQVLAAAVHDRAHALLDSAVLDVDAVDAGEGLGLLYLAVDQVVVRAV